MKLLRRILVSAALGIALFGIALASAYLYFTISTIEVDNQSAYALENVEVALSRNTYDLGTLPSGQKTWVWGAPDRDGVLAITFRAAGRTIHEDFDYVTPHMAEHYPLVVSKLLTVTRERAK